MTALMQTIFQILVANLKFIGDQNPSDSDLRCDLLVCLC